MNQEEKELFEKIVNAVMSICVDVIYQDLPELVTYARSKSLLRNITEVELYKAIIVLKEMKHSLVLNESIISIGVSVVIRDISKNSVSNEKYKIASKTFKKRCTDYLEQLNKSL